MQTQSRDARSDAQQKRKRFSWMIGVLVSSVLIVILVFVVVTLLVLSSQGVTQGITTLTILSIVAGFVVSVLSLLISFLQWHHPKAPLASEEIIAASVDHSPPLSASEHPQSDIFPNDPERERMEKKMALPSASRMSQRFDWGEAPHMKQLYGRDQELATLKQWMIDDSCRIVTILGMGGIGKTSLAATLVDQVHQHYECIFWRSLHNAPPLKHLLQECIQFVSDQQQTASPEEIDSQISLLMTFLRTRRCLLILDNIESILQGASQAGQYREGYEGYGRLIIRIGESKHQSCLLATSREKPQEVALLEGETAATRSLHLEGLEPAAGRDILKDKGLQGAEHDWEALINHYGGNPLALKLVAQTIREVFGSTIITFLRDGEVFFRDVRDVLEQQMKRLSAREEEIVYWLAIEREAITLSDLQEHLVRPVPKGELQEALQSLRRRQLIETHTIGFTLHHVIMEYLTARFVDQVCDEIRTGKLVLFERHALLLAQAKDYIRESQRCLILQPLLHRLLTTLEQETLEQRCQSLLATLHAQHDYHSNYAAGNVLNLLLQAGSRLRGYDFSHLVVRQAYLQGVELPEVNFAHADLATSVFTDTFGGILCVAWSRQGDLLATGTVTGEIRLWSAVSGLPLQTIWGHTDWVKSVAFSPDGKTLASGSDDQTVRLWEVSSGKCLHTLHGHTGWISSVAFSPDGRTLASVSKDRTVCLWEVSSGKSLNTLHGHTEAVRSVAFSPDGRTLASVSKDQTVRLWEVSSGKSRNTLHGHTQAIRSVAFSPDGRILASVSEDQTVRLWEVSSGKSLNTLHGHTNVVWSAAFSPDGRTLASVSEDQMVCLWEVSSGKSRNTLHGHTQAIRSVAFSPDDKILASGSADQTVRLWEVSSGKLLNTLHGHSRCWSVAFSPDGRTLASVSDDQTVRLWEVSSGKSRNTLHSHTQAIRSVAFSPDGKILASGSADQTVRLWEVSSGKLLNTFYGHTNVVRSVAFSPDGKILASGSEDQMVCLWKVSDGKLLNTFYGHSYWVSSVAFSPDGKTLASSSADQTVRLWEVSSGKSLNTFYGHTNVVRSVAFSPDGRILASVSEDQMVCLWEVSSGKSLNTLHGHTEAVRSVAFSPDGKILASGSADQTVRLWEVSNGKVLNTLHGHSRWLYSVAFSPDGKTLASSSSDQTACLWEVSSGKLLNTLHGHSHWVSSVAFSPDGKALASGSLDGTINIWDSQAGSCLLTLRSDRPYEQMNIAGVKGLTEAQKATLRSLGAVENE